jgi:hypothetical protein
MSVPQEPAFVPLMEAEAMSRVSALLCVCVVVLATGCASIVSKSTYAVQVTSNPPGATVNVKNKVGADVFTGTTPTTVMLKAGKSYFSSGRYTFTFTKPGYDPATRVLASDLDLWYLGNILFGGIIGMLIVDPITGDMWKLDEYVNASLPQAGMAPAVRPMAPAGGGAGSLEADLAQLKGLRDSGVLTEEEYQKKRQEVIAKWNP